jgi:hypothetical protein
VDVSDRLSAAHAGQVRRQIVGFRDLSGDSLAAEALGSLMGSS